jgi:hypothetical protein
VLAYAGQIVAGTPEDKLFQQISSETDLAAKESAVTSFEEQFPQSSVLPDVYLMMVELYRQKGDRGKVIEYGEKTLKLDGSNVTAMMVVARNYALEGKNLPRALELAQEAFDQSQKMRAQPAPPQFTAAQWQDYLQNTETAARNTLGYVRSVTEVSVRPQ